MPRELFLPEGQRGRAYRERVYARWEDVQRAGLPEDALTAGTVQVAADYSLPFIGKTITLRGTATMRMEQPAEFAGGGACV